MWSSKPQQPVLIEQRGGTDGKEGSDERKEGGEKAALLLWRRVSTFLL
jgi:hypothetical protein